MSGSPLDKDTRREKRQENLISRFVVHKRRFKHIAFLLCTFLFFIFLSVSCHKRKEEPKNVLVKINGTPLTIEEILEKVPVGLHPNDSLAMIHALIESKIKDALLVEFAESRLYDLDEIERKVNDYRNKLILMEYIKNMRNRQEIILNQEEIKDYYEKNKQDLLTERPLIKGIILKINTSVPERYEIKKLLYDLKEENIDELEKNWLDKVVSYEYFRDKWIDWETISDMIPYRFDDPDEFLRQNHYFETEYGDCAYYLQITDYLPTGSLQPYDFASTWISSLLNQKSLTEYENTLIESLIKKSIDEKKLEIVGYDPLKHQFINRKENQ